MLKIYEVKIPMESTNPKEEMSLKVVNVSKKNENAVVKQEINTASAEFLILLTLNIE